MSADQLRKLDQHQRDRVVRRPPDVAIGLEDARDAGARDQVARQIEIERRQRQGLVVDDLDRGAAVAEDDDRTEGRVVGHADDQFARLRTHDHRMDGDAGDARVGLGRARPRQNLGGGFAHRGLAGEVEPDAADVRFVDDVAATRILTTTRVPSARNGAAAATASSGVARQRRRASIGIA